MREYETVFVLRPDGAETEINQLLEKLNSTIERHGGTIFQQRNWGKKELAYRVQKYKQGVYFYYNYCGESGLISDLERTLKLHELPMKYLTVKLSDDVDITARKKEIKNEEEKVKAAPATTSVTTPVGTAESEDSSEEEVQNA